MFTTFWEHFKQTYTSQLLIFLVLSFFPTIQQKHPTTNLSSPVVLLPLPHSRGLQGLLAQLRGQLLGELRHLGLGDFEDLLEVLGEGLHLTDSLIFLYCFILMGHFFYILHQKKNNRFPNVQNVFLPMTCIFMT